MLALFLAAAAASLVPQSEPLKGQLQSAIWTDLQLNAIIGNGNWLASLWYNVGSDTAPDLHIVELRCSQAGSTQRCSFKLLRDGGPTVVLGETAPAKLACVALFARTKEVWSVVHRPPREAGHSQTSMRCEALKQ